MPNSINDSGSAEGDTDTMFLKKLISHCDESFDPELEREYMVVKLKVLGFVMSTAGKCLTQHNSQQMPWPIQELLEKFPDMTTALDSNDWLPLHWAAAGGDTITPHDIEVIIQKIPLSCRQASNSPSKILPIHVLCCQSVPNMEVAEELIGAYPFSVMQTDSEGFLPLHVAALYTSSVPFLRFLLQATGKSLYHTTRQCQSCLHLAVDNPHENILQTLLNVWPEGLQVQQTSKLAESPLFFAIRRGNLTAVALMLNVDPSLSRKRNFEKLLPLHFAAQFSTLAVVKYLLKADPDVANITSGPKNSFPLHLVGFNPNDEVFSFVLSETPVVPPMEFAEAHRFLQHDNGHGAEMAASGIAGTVDPVGFPLTTIDILNTMDCWLKDVDGMHPIHTLMLSEALSKSRIQLFLKKLATHYAMTLGSSKWSENLNPVLYAQAFLFLMKDNGGNTPLHLLIKSMHSCSRDSEPTSQDKFSFQRVDILDCLLKNAPEACLILNNMAEFPLHIFAYVIDKLLGCCCRLPSPTNRRQYAHIHHNHACEVMRMLLRHTDVQFASVRLPSHLEARLEILGNESNDVAAELTMTSGPETSFLFEDIDMSSFNDIHEDDSFLQVSTQQECNNFSMLEMRNANGENIYDLLTRSSVSVDLGNSFSAGLYRTDREDLLLYCNVPAHHQLSIDQGLVSKHGAEQFDRRSSRPEFNIDATVRHKKKQSFSFDSASAKATSGQRSASSSELCTRSLLKRMVLRAHPSFNKPLLQELNYRSRRMALFLGYCAGSITTSAKKREVNIFAKLTR